MNTSREIQKANNKGSDLRSLLARWDVMFPTCVIIAFVGVYFFRPAVGPVSSLPIIFACAFGCAFIGVPVWQKCAVFFGEAFFVLLFQGNGLNTSAVFSALAAVVCLSACLFVGAVRRKKLAPIVLSSAFVALCLAAHLYFCGQPWNLFARASQLEDYISENYGDEPLIKEKPCYDYKTGDVTARVSYTKDPTVRSEIKLTDGNVTDEYREYAEKYVMRSAVAELTSVLREAFPNGNFAVESRGILNYPRGDKVTATVNGPERYMTINVHISEQLTKTQFINAAKDYYNAIMRSGFYCNRIIFTCGGAKDLPAQIDVPLVPAVEDFEKLFAPTDKFFEGYFD